jgi:hypothetical protein
MLWVLNLDTWDACRDALQQSDAGIVLRVCVASLEAHLPVKLSVFLYGRDLGPGLEMGNLNKGYTDIEDAVQSIEERASCGGWN